MVAATTNAQMVRRPPLVAPPPDWRQQLPELTGTHSTLRELRLSDAPALLSTMTSDDVARFISTPPTSVDGFERFITWARHQRGAGRYACFAVVPHGLHEPVGLFQVRRMDEDTTTGEWGFALGQPYWGQGHFVDAARLVLAFAFDEMNLRRLEARSAVANGRGNGALRKVGAVHEGVMRRAFRKDGQRLDQSLWSILADEWRAAEAVQWPALVH